MAEVTIMYESDGDRWTYTVEHPEPYLALEEARLYLMHQRNRARKAWVTYYYNNQGVSNAKSQEEHRA